MKSRIFIILLSLLSLHNGSFATSLKDAKSQIENALSIEIVYDTLVTDSWSSVRYETCDDSTTTLKYLDLLYKEYIKYPKGYFQLAGIKTIVLAEKLRFQAQYRAAIPDPFKNTLYLSIDGQNGNFTVDYLIHVMHHELNHCTEYAIWKDMYYKWKKWKKTNRLFFRYLGAGVMAYERESVDWYIMNHPKKGFMNLYSTTAQEEDRSDLIAVIMSDEGRKNLAHYYPVDKILRAKIDLLVTNLNAFCMTTNTYWQKKFLS